MKITSVEAFLVPPRWMFVRIGTDAGVVGWGEAGVQANHRSVAAAADELGALLLGQDPRRHQWHWQRLHSSGFYRGGAVLSAALASLDIALWDLTGRALGVPVHQLLGGPVRDRLPAYVWLGNERNDDAPAVLADEARQWAAQGVTRFKLTVPSFPPTGYGPAIDLAESQFAAVRRAGGTGADVMVDCHGRTDARQARALISELAQYRPLFVEEPVRPDDLRALASICATTHVPIAAGERAFDRRESLELLEAGVTVLQPDIAQSGGFSETLRICTLASVHGARVAPHCAIGPVALAASLQLGFAAPEVIAQENPDIRSEREVFRSYLVDPTALDLTNGYFPRSDRPGIGVDVDEDVVRGKARPGHGWVPPMTTHPDGGVAEW